MEDCEHCRYYDESDSYPGTGWCSLEKDYVKENDNCQDWEGE